MRNAERPFAMVIKTIIGIEIQLESLRQSINQEPLFNIHDTFDSICSNSLINAFEILSFTKRNQKELSSFESMIKMYNNNESTTLNKNQLATVFLSRKNPLMAKLVLERPSYGLIQPEIERLCVMILRLEGQIHKHLVKYRLSGSVEQILPGISNQISIDLEKLRELMVRNGLQGSTGQLVRYMGIGDRSGTILVNTFRRLFQQSNCKVVRDFLLKKKELPKNVNPLIDPKFQSLLSSPKTLNCFNHRQKRSIQSHLNRIKCQRRTEVFTKLEQYRKLMEEEAMALVTVLKHMMYFLKQIQFSKMELSLCSDFQPRLFFESYDLDRECRIIPSTMKYHLDKLGIDYPVNQIYHLFRRYSGDDGKMTLGDFQSLFAPVQMEYLHIPKNTRVGQLSQVSTPTKRLYLQVLSAIIANQTKINQVKTQLSGRQYFDLRNIFNCIDNDEDGCVSMLDFQVLVKKCMSLEMSKLDLQLLSHRFKKSSLLDMICYAEFVLQLTPSPPIPLPKCKSDAYVKTKH